MSSTLIYKSSRSIRAFCKRNRIDWGRREWVANLLTPTSMVELWLDLLKERKDLFTQQDFVQYVFTNEAWESWLKERTPAETKGMVWRLKRNIYPSMIDSLDTWAMHAETGVYDKCVVDSLEDAIGKTDVTLWRGSDHRVICLMGWDNECARKWDAIKEERRGARPTGAQKIWIPKERKVGVGNKRWYEPEDFFWLMKTQPCMFRNGGDK